MAPEYGATMGYFPVDSTTVRYLEDTNRDSTIIDRVKMLDKIGLFRHGGEQITFTDSLQLDLNSV